MRLPPVAKLLESQILMAAKNKHSPRLRDRRDWATMLGRLELELELAEVRAVLEGARAAEVATGKETSAPTLPAASYS